jgi:hypothetical protein
VAGDPGTPYGHAVLNALSTVDFGMRIRLATWRTLRPCVLTERIKRRAQC